MTPPETAPDTATLPANARLTAEQVEAFKKDGYILYNQPVFPDHEFAALKNHFEMKLDYWTKQGKSPEHMDTPHFTDTWLFHWVLSDYVLDLVEPLLGPDIALWSTHFICKPAGVGKRVPWHEDSAYWGRVLDPMEVVTVWLAVDPSMVENGCMRVIPGTHHGGYSQYEEVEEGQVFDTEIKADSFDESKAVDCILKPNECSIHHAKLIHGSNPNTGTQRRCGYTMRFVPASSAYRPDKSRQDSFQIYMARGQDKAGNEYGNPTEPNWKYIDATEEQRRAAKALA